MDIALLSLTLRAGAKAPRLAELIHRAIPYPVFLIQSQPGGITLFLAHLRWSEAKSGKTVLDGPLVSAQLQEEECLGCGKEANSDNASSPPAQVSSRPLLSFFTPHALTAQPLHDLNQRWIERFEAFAAARLSGNFTHAPDAAAAECRRTALAEHERIHREIKSLRARAAREKQINRRVEQNLQVKQLEASMAQHKRCL